jgi:solute carrier family 25 protein 38
MRKQWLISRNVPGVAIYFYALSAIRTELSYLSQFQTLAPLSTISTSTSGSGSGNGSGSALVKLSVPGNLIAGAIARTSVGVVLNPITVLKARYEVRPVFHNEERGKRADG